MPNSYAATNTKKFLDANGLAHFAQRLNQYPTNEVIEAVVEGIQDALDEKLDENKVGQANGVASLDANGKVPNSQLPTDANTTYTITQDQTDGHKFTLAGTDGSSTTITIPDENTTYSTATQSTEGLMSSTDKRKLDGIAAGATDNLGTITGITMNGVSKGVAGVVDLGTVLTEHQDISGKLNANLKGVANGVADLDENGYVPSSQLPSYVDDVLEYNGRDSFPVTGEAGKIYVDISEGGGNKTYRWSGSTYTEISPSLALGTTSSTAFRGDHGNAAYAHAVTNKGSAFESGLYKITTNAEGHVTSASPVIKTDITSLGIPAQDTTYVFDQVYDPMLNKAATEKTISDAIETLSGGAIGSGATNKTLISLSQSNGNVSATFDLISITKSQISDLETLGQAAVKDVDTMIATESISENLPTSQAVAAFVEGKGYVTTDNNTTYSLVQNPNNGSDLTLVGSDGTSQQVLIPNTTYTFSDNSPTLNWNTRSTIGTVGDTELHVTLPANPNTDTSVTSASNHYTPVTDSESSLTANASGATAAWGTDIVRGLTLNTDGKGHVTNVSVQSGKLPSLGTTAGTAAEGNHVHTTTIASSISASQITLEASTKYQITAGGTTYVFTTPPNTTYSAITDAEIDSIFA